MATQEETAAVREAFDKLSALILRPDTPLTGGGRGTGRDRLALSLYSLLADAHNLAGIILDMDRADTDEATGGPAPW